MCVLMVSIDFLTSASSFLPSFRPRIGEIVGREDLPLLRVLRVKRQHLDLLRTQAKDIVLCMCVRV